MTWQSCVGCGKPAMGRRCRECLRRWRRVYDANRPAHHATYSTAAWRKLSGAVRSEATRCHWCGKLTSRLVADHVVPIEVRPDLALEPSNVVASCVGCNTRRGRNLAPVRWRQVTVDEAIARVRRGERP